MIRGSFTIGNVVLRSCEVVKALSSDCHKVCESIVPFYLKYDEGEIFREREREAAGIRSCFYLYEPNNYIVKNHCQRTSRVRRLPELPSTFNITGQPLSIG